MSALAHALPRGGGAVSLLAQGGPRGGEEVRARIQEILAREEFRGRAEGPGAWLRELLRELLRKIGDLFDVPEPAVVEAVTRVLLVAIVVLLFVLVFLLVRRRLAARGSSGEDPSATAGDGARAARVARLRAEAAAASARGEHVAALRLSFFALVIGLSERGELEYRDAWTNRELLERGSPRPEVLPLLAPIVPALDARSFGGAPAGPEDVAEMESLCDRLLARARR